MKIALLLLLSALGIWYNGRSCRAWWGHQRQHLPKPSDVYAWVGVGFSVLWYAFLFVFFAGLTINNTLLR